MVLVEGLVRPSLGSISLANSFLQGVVEAKSAVGIANRKAMAFLVLLTTWEIWNERNDRVFQNKHTSLQAIFSKIKNEAKVWIIAGAKRLEEILLEE